MIAVEENSELIIWLEDGVSVCTESAVNEKDGFYRSFNRDFNLQPRRRMSAIDEIGDKLMQERLNWKLRVNWTYRIIGRYNFNAH